MSWLRTVVVMPALAFIEKVVSFLIQIPTIGLQINRFLSCLASLSRNFAGSFAQPGLEQCERPKKPLILYEYEGCPFCRRVREAISALALDVIIYPCPRVTLGEYGVAGESRYRPIVQDLVGKCIFPILVDPNIPTAGNGDGVIVGVDKLQVIQDSSNIVDYLWREYGKHLKPISKSSAPFLALPTVFRPLPSMGVMMTPSRCPKVPLELFGYEHEIDTRLVREKLDSLEIPYISHNIPKGATFRELEYQQRFKTSKVVLPRLVDANSSVDEPTNLTRVGDMLIYLDSVYATGQATTTSWTSYSTKGASAQHGVFQ